MRGLGLTPSWESPEVSFRVICVKLLMNVFLKFSILVADFHWRVSDTQCTWRSIIETNEGFSVSLGKLLSNEQWSRDYYGSPAVSGWPAHVVLTIVYAQYSKCICIIQTELKLSIHKIITSSSSFHREDQSELQHVWSKRIPLLS